MKREKTTVTVRQFKLAAEAHSRLRILAIERGRKIGEIVREIVEEYVSTDGGFLRKILNPRESKKGRK